MLNHSKADRVRVLLSFFIPVLVLSSVYALFRVEPFGSNCILFGDMQGQYPYFFSDMRETFGPGLFYSWHKALGGEALSFCAYYLFSPFNLLLLLFPASRMGLAVVLITLLKTGCAGLCMYLLLRHRSGSGWMQLALSAAYALSGYMLGFAQNLMWLDGVILLPLIVWGIDRILQGGRPWLYLVSLCLGIFSCYYIGWMLCIFSALYFVLHWLLDAPADRWKCAGCFAAASLLAGGLNLWAVLPSYLALKNGKAEAAMNWGLETNFSFSQLVRQFFAGAYPEGQATNELPLIFCGTLPLLLVLVFFISRCVPLRSKLSGGLLLVVLLASFWLRTPDLIWHGFQAPTWFPHRYSFLFIFMILSLANEGWTALRKSQIRWLRPAAGVLCAVLAGELILNSYAALRSFRPYTSELPEIAQQHTEQRQLLTPGSDEFYRVLSPEAFSQNEAFLLNYAGIAHYSSSYYSALCDTLRSLGLTTTSGWCADSPGITQGSASLLAARYSIGTDPGGSWEALEPGLHQNPAALPVAFAAAQVPEQRLPTDLCFENLEQIYSSLLGRSAGIYTQIPDPEPQLTGLTGADGDYMTADPTQSGSLSWTFSAPADGELYCYFPVLSEYCGGLVRFNGEHAGKVLQYRNSGTLHLGFVRQGETVTVQLTSQSNRLLFALGHNFYLENTAALQQAADDLRNGGLVLEHQQPGLLWGKISAADGTAALFTSIPFDRGWQVKVDGQPVTPFCSLNSLLAVPLTAGEHTLELRFVPPALAVSIGISLFSLLAALLWFFLSKKSLVKKSQRSAPAEPN